MTNIIILFCTIFCGLLVGKHFEKQQKQRGDFFTDLCKYIKLLKSNVKGRRIQLAVFNEEFALSSSVVFAEFLKCSTNVSFLTKNQKQLVQSLFESLSATTSQQLLANLDYFEQLVSVENEAIYNSVRNRFVCVKLGVLLGVMTGILLM